MPVPFQKISTPGNLVKLPYFSQSVVVSYCYSATSTLTQLRLVMSISLHQSSVYRIRECLFLDVYLNISEKKSHHRCYVWSHIRLCLRFFHSIMVTLMQLQLIKFVLKILIKPQENICGGFF